MTWNEEAEKWIEVARNGHDPNAADTERVRRALVARGVIVAGGIAGSVATTAGAAASATTVKALIVQASAALIVAGSMATATTMFFESPRALSSSSVPAASAGAPTDGRARGASTTAVAGELPRARGEAPSTAASAEPRAQVARPTAGSTSVRPVPRASRIPASSTGAPSPALEREIAGLRSAQQALHRGETESAARALDQLEETSPGGALLEERLATRSILACSSGNDRAALQDFLERYPASLHRERVLAACAPKPAVGRFPETGSTGQDH